MYVFETLIFRWREALRESSGNFEELQELFEIVVKFRDPQVKPRLQKIIERSPKFSELLSSDRIADALIQGDLLRGIVNWSGVLRDGNFACRIHPAAQSAIGKQQWVTVSLCVQCCRMVDSVPIWHTISIL